MDRSKLLANDERRFTFSHNSYIGRPFDQFDLIAVGRVNEDEPAAGRGCGRAVGDIDPSGIERGDRLVEAFDLKGQMDEVFLHFHWTAWWKTGQFNQLVAVGNLQEGEM